MNREQRIAIWVATLIGMLVAWKLFGQSFGSFVRDQPFLAANPAAVTDELSRWPTNLISYFDTLSDTNVILSEGTVVTNWINKKNASDPATNNLTDSPVWVSTNGAAGTNGYVDFRGNAGGADWLFFHPSNGLSTLTLPITVACVYWLDVVFISGHGPALFGSAHASGTPGSGVLVDLDYAPAGLHGVVGERTSDFVSTEIAPSISTWHRVVAILGDVSSDIHMWTNGTYVGTFNITSAAAAIGNYQLGRFNEYGYLMDGRMARFMMWNRALSSNECVQVDTLMKDDFGL